MDKNSFLPSFMIMKRLARHALAVGVVFSILGIADRAKALDVDLAIKTTGTYLGVGTTYVNSIVTVDGVIYTADAQNGSGSGALQSLYKIEMKNGTNIESGFNTLGTEPPDVKNNSSSAIRLQNVSVVNVTGVDYFGFTLDFNEGGSGQDLLLSLNAFKLYTSSVNNLSDLSLADLRFNMDGQFSGDITVLLDQNRAGSGQGSLDFTILVPVSYFAMDGGKDGTDFVYIYSELGGPLGGPATTRMGFEFYADGSFDEWATRVRPIPEASAFLPIALVVAPVLMGRRRRSAA